ncbi:hypothetical protein [Mycobacterium heidelbergense]|nr:hypothetical protein [Mycobacterium heidelbergense]
MSAAGVEWGRSAAMQRARVMARSGTIAVLLAVPGRYFRPWGFR